MAVLPPLHPTAALAPRALLPGDPGRALRLAQELLDAPLMFNHARGLWGYTGLAADGEPLTIQSTGLGGPSVAAVLEQLAGLGLEVAVRTGTCRSDGLGPPLGTVGVVGRALAHDGVSVAAGARVVQPDLEFAGDLEVRSCDRLSPEGGPDSGLLDRSTAPFLVVARQLGLRCGAVLAVVARGTGATLGEEALLATERELGRTAAALLGLRERVV